MVSLTTDHHRPGPSRWERSVKGEMVAEIPAVPNHVAQHSVGARKGMKKVEVEEDIFFF